MCLSFFFFNDTATTEIYPLSLHDALPILTAGREVGFKIPVVVRLEGNEVEKAREILTAVKAELPAIRVEDFAGLLHLVARSEEHTSELQSRSDLVCRLLLEKKKKNRTSRD